MIRATASFSRARRSRFPSAATWPWGTTPTTALTAASGALSRRRTSWEGRSSSTSPSRGAGAPRNDRLGPEQGGKHPGLARGSVGALRGGDRDLRGPLEPFLVGLGCQAELGAVRRGGGQREGVRGREGDASGDQGLKRGVLQLGAEEVHLEREPPCVPEPGVCPHEVDIGGLQVDAHEDRGGVGGKAARFHSAHLQLAVEDGGARRQRSEPVALQEEDRKS